MTPTGARRATRRARIALAAGEGDAPPREAGWDERPRSGAALSWLLPAALAHHPSIAFGWGGAPAMDDADLRGAARAEALWWPASRSDAVERAAVVDLRGLAAPEAGRLLTLALDLFGADGAAALAGPGQAAQSASELGFDVLPGPEHLRPEALTQVVGASGAPSAYWAAVGGVEALTPDGPADPGAWLSRARFVDPWRGEPCGAEEGLSALAFLRRAAMSNAKRAVTVGFSRWRRRNAAPFLAGPAGPPLHRGTEAQAIRTARREGGRLAVWGMRELDGAAGLETVRLEDGFVRSVGLGLQHAPPASLAVDREGLYFDATRATDFERIAREAEFTPELLARAKVLRERLIDLRITKYNLAKADAPPEAPSGRRRILVPGQVEGDASLRWGSPQVHRNAELLRRARARSPEAFILYKPHPDVLTGLRRGAVDDETLSLADAVAENASAAACLDWADEVETMTSLMGFEALLRGRDVTTHGRPFYAGWGLTGSAGEPFDRGRALCLDALTAAALILYPRYIDPGLRLPAPPERVLEWLHDERAFVRTPQGKARQAWRRAISQMLNIGRR